MTVATTTPNAYVIHQRWPHAKQRDFINSTVKRKVIRAGRRSGKTTGIAIYAVDRFLAKRRILYAAPTQDQVERFWHEVTTALAEPLEARFLYKNETKHLIELPGSETRIRAKQRHESGQRPPGMPTVCAVTTPMILFSTNGSL
jgi:hypothetical protein